MKYKMCIKIVVLILICGQSVLASGAKVSNVTKPVKAPAADAPKEHQVISIWPKGTKGINPEIPEKAKPCNKRFYNIHNPNLTVYRPGKPNGTSIIIMSGGGYSYISVGVEGIPTAVKLNKMGVTVFVLKYRLPAQYKHPAQLHDALRAVQWVRHNAADFGVDPDKIGVAGFSAGGHLASMSGTLFDQKVPGNDKISKQSPRPDFMCLIYPVISAHVKGVAHSCPSRLLNKGYSQQQRKSLSSDLNVTKRTPPTFLGHAKDDRGVPCKNSELMYAALVKCKVPAMLKIYEKGGHGGSFGGKGVDSEQWLNHFQQWLIETKLISSPALHN